MALAHRFSLIAGASAALTAGAGVADATPAIMAAATCASPSFDRYPAPAAAARAPRTPPAAPLAIEPVQ